MLSHFRLLRRSHNLASSEAPPGKRQARPTIAMSSLFGFEESSPGPTAISQGEEYDQKAAP
jgi:hypothetical protein